MIRATDLSTIGVTLEHLRRQSSQFAQAQEQVSSGQRVNLPSDDPAALRIGLRETRRIESLDSQTQVLDQLHSTLAHTETATREAHSILVRVKEIALSGRQSTEPTERQVLSQELGTLRDRLFYQAYFFLRFALPRSSQSRNISVMRCRSSAGRREP